MCQLKARAQDIIDTRQAVGKLLVTEPTFLVGVVANEEDLLFWISIANAVLARQLLGHVDAFVIMFVQLDHNNSIWTCVEAEESIRANVDSETNLFITKGKRRLAQAFIARSAKEPEECLLLLALNRPGVLVEATPSTLTAGSVDRKSLTFDTFGCSVPRKVAIKGTLDPPGHVLAAIMCAKKTWLVVHRFVHVLENLLADEALSANITLMGCLSRHMGFLVCAQRR